MKLQELSEIELIKAILKCDREIAKMVTWDIHSIEHYPGQLMGLGDFYCEKYMLMNELLKRKTGDNLL